MSLSVVQRMKSLPIPFRLRLLQFSLPKSKEDDFFYYNKDGFFQGYYRFRIGLLGAALRPNDGRNLPT
ncbi:MAG: hypothetical protein H6Q94_961 [Nitrospirae bacterium]|nr:hypothetical protein [Nitrospirota bacterium]